MIYFSNSMAWRLICGDRTDLNSVGRGEAMLGRSNSPNLAQDIVYHIPASHIPKKSVISRLHDLKRLPTSECLLSVHLARAQTSRRPKASSQVIEYGALDVASVYAV